MNLFEGEGIMGKTVKIGLLGCGTVGGGVIIVLNENRDDIARKAGCTIEVKTVLVRDKANLKPEIKKYNVGYTDNLDDILNDPEIDIVVELIGRVHPAKEYIEAALKHGKHVVTANKDVLAEYGKALFTLAEENHVDFQFEGAVGGGIPIIRPLRSCLAANKISSIMGIVNGTTNYMLTRMTEAGLSYENALAEAQAKGYAESDPTADVEGIDAARKITVLASLAFNTALTLKDVHIEGIDNVDACDISYARDLGYVVKLLGVAKNDPVQVHE
jgi:homoserine dehydrogenase